MEEEVAPRLGVEEAETDLCEPLEDGEGKSLLGSVQEARRDSGSPIGSPESPEPQGTAGSYEVIVLME